MVVVVAEILFSGISGSTAADVSAISSLLVPSMRRAGYSGPESVSVVAAASAMGILVPPCLTMVVLGSLVNLSIVTLFLAGFVPAFILAGALLVLIALRARRQNWPVTTGASRADLGARDPARAIVPTGLPVRAVRRHLLGATTVTEAALIAVVYALVAGNLHGRRSSRRDRRPARAERHRDGDDALGAGRGVGVRVDPGARMGAADAGRMDRRRRRRPRRLSWPRRSSSSW